MILSILHFSDIHFTEGRNAIFQRKEKVFDAIKNHLKGKESCFLLTSGDIAFSGKEEEYKVAMEFYKYFFKSIKDYTTLKTHFLFVPGNHDCFFNAETDKLRQLILESLSQKGLSELSEELIKICCSPQENFDKFVEKVNKRLDYNGDIFFNHPLLKIYTFKCDERILKFNCFNTSWDSTLHEKIGNLQFPIDYLYDQIPSIENFLSFSIVHHPFNWQTPSNSKEFREALSFSSDFIISGHEHEGNVSLFTDLQNQYNTIHIESAALQETNKERESHFNIIDIDIDENKFKILKYSYKQSSNKYLLAEESDWKKIEKDKKLKSKDYQLKKDFFKKLENPGATFYNSNVDEIFLSDIYIPPYFNNITIDKERKKKFFDFVHSDSALEIVKGKKFLKLVLGDESAGKTALLKSFFLKFYNKKLYPIFFSVNDINEVSQDGVKSLVEKQFKKQYDELEKTFSDINYDDIVIIIDDLQLFKPKKSKITLIKSLTELFSKIYYGE